MNKKLLFFVSLMTLILVGCGNDSLQKVDESSEKNPETIKTTDASSAELEGIPNKTYSPEVNNEVISTFSEYEQLNKNEQNELIYDYLINSLTSLAGSEESAEDLLKEKGFSSDQLDGLTDIFEEVKKEYPKDSLNELFIKVVNKVMNN